MCTADVHQIVQLMTRLCCCALLLCATTCADVQLMTRLCEAIMASLLELLGSTISIMSAAALATLFLEMNFIEGIIPDALKTEDFDNRINDCYELLLTQLLRLVQAKMPSQRTEIGKVRCCHPHPHPNCSLDTEVFWALSGTCI